MDCSCLPLNRKLNAGASQSCLISRQAGWLAGAKVQAAQLLEPPSPSRRENCLRKPPVFAGAVTSAFIVVPAAATADTVGEPGTLHVEGGPGRTQDPTLWIQFLTVHSNDGGMHALTWASSQVRSEGLMGPPPRH